MPALEINNRQVYLCGSCSTKFIWPQPSEDEIRAIYSKNYYDSWGITGEQGDGSVKAMKTATFERRMDLIEKHIKPGKILDIGCACGYFLETAAKRGFTPYGVELSDYSCKIAKESLGEENIFNGTIENAPFDDKSFDAVAMSDLLEHVTNPNKTLSKVRGLLKDGGVIMIMTPDHGSLTAALMGRRWTHYKEEHLFYFNRRALKYILDKNGFKVLEVRSAEKAMNLKYFKTQFNIYTNALITPLVNLAVRLLPERFLSKNFYLPLGEMAVIAVKK